VTDAPTEAVLQDIVRRESRSLLQYVADAFPWTTEEERGVLATLRQLIDEERQAAGDLARFMTRRRLELPYIGAYPAEFTTINYVLLDHLLPLLADEERRAVAALEKGLDALRDPDARARVQNVLDMKRRHLQTLDKLVATHPQPAAAS
jgi:rubrerythrin